MAPEPEIHKNDKPTDAVNSITTEEEVTSEDNPEDGTWNNEMTSEVKDQVSDNDKEDVDEDSRHILDSSDSGHVTQDSNPVMQNSADHVTEDSNHVNDDASLSEKDSHESVAKNGLSPETIEQNEPETDIPDVITTDEQQPENISCFDEPTPPVPPDGGYGWVIVFCGFMVNLLVDGMCYMGGVLYIELLDYFQEPKGKTQWVHTLVPAVYLLTGPFVGALVNKYGCRVITMTGSLIAGTFFLISALVPSVEALIFTYGIMIGIGFGLMYLPAVCFVSYYFDRRRAMATGISVCGSGIGTFIFPPFMNYLISMYGWRGSLLILSGLSLNCCVFGALMRPLVASKPKAKKFEEEKETTRKLSKKEKRQQKQMEQQRSIIMQKIIEQKKRQRTVSNGSLDGMVITIKNQLVKDPALLKLILNSETQNKLANSAVLNISAPDLRVEMKPRTFSNISEVSVSLQTSRTDLDEHTEKPVTPQLVNKHLQNVTGGLRRRDRSESNHNGSRLSLRNGNATSSIESLERKRKDMARVMYRQDIFYTGSVTSIAEYKSNPDIDQYTQSVVSIPASETSGATGNCAPFTNVINQMFDLSLFKSVTFIVLISNAFFSFLGFFVPFMFLPDLAKIMGATGSEAALLISVLGACNTFGRLAAGWLADRQWADCLIIQNVALITGGIATAMVPLFTTYALLAAYCCVFGTCMAMFIALRSIVTAEMMGVHKLNNAFGLTIFFQGVAGTAGSPLAGTIFDATGSYTISFIIAGSFIAFSGVICLPLRRIALWENAKSPIIDTEYHVVTANDDFNLPLPDPEFGESGKVHFNGSGKDVHFADLNTDNVNEV